MNLTVPREHLFEQPDGTWWFVVKGEIASTTDDFIEYGVDPMPPDDLVALAAPCETCNDTRMARIEYTGECEHRYTDMSGGNYTAMESCRDCRSRRDGYGFGPWERRGPCPDCADRTLTIETECPSAICDPGCIVSLGPFRIETPVSIQSRDMGDYPAVWIHPGTRSTYFRSNLDDEDEQINLGPDPAQFIGWYAVKAVTP